MKALLLAAGLGTRCRPLTEVIPKCLLPIHGRPLLEYWLTLLAQTQVEQCLVNLHYYAEEVSRFLQGYEAGAWVQSVYESELLGTGGTLVTNQGFFGEEAALLIHADNLCYCDFDAFIRAHQQRPSEAQITMMTFTTPTPQSCGIVELDERGIVQRFHEKVSQPPGNLANAAIYIFEPSVIEEMRSWGRPVIDVSTEVLPRYLGQIYTWHNAEYHRDIGNLQSLLEAQHDYLHPPPKAPTLDPWAIRYGANATEAAQHVMRALAKGLEACVAPLTPDSPNALLQGVTSSINENTPCVLLVADTLPTNITPLLEAYQQRYPQVQQWIAFAHTAPAEAIASISSTPIPTWVLYSDTK